MAQLKTLTEIREDVLYRAGEQTNDQSDFYDKSLEYINRARLDLIKGISPLDPMKRVDFNWAIEYPPSNFTIQPMVDDGTVSVTQGSSTITFSSAPSNIKNWMAYYL